MVSVIFLAPKIRFSPQSLLFYPDNISDSFQDSDFLFSDDFSQLFVYFQDSGNDKV